MGLSLTEWGTERGIRCLNGTVLVLLPKYLMWQCKSHTDLAFLGDRACRSTKFWHLLLKGRWWKIMNMLLQFCDTRDILLPKNAPNIHPSISMLFWSYFLLSLVNLRIFTFICYNYPTFALLPKRHLKKRHKLHQRYNTSLMASTIRK